MSWRGIAYPVKAGEKGLFNVKTDVDLIEGNIIQILGTRKGERVMLPEFGSKIMDFIFEPLDYITCALIRFELITSIKRWEPRIILDKDNTNVIAYPLDFMVKAQMRYFLKPRNGDYTFVLGISRRGGVRRWLD